MNKRHHLRIGVPAKQASPPADTGRTPQRGLQTEMAEARSRLLQALSEVRQAPARPETPALERPLREYVKAVSRYVAGVEQALLNPPKRVCFPLAKRP